MFHQKINLPENHSRYPHIWKSEYGRFRIIRCTDDLQWIVQQYRSPKWRNKSYHREWWSVEKCWNDKNLAGLNVST